MSHLVDLIDEYRDTHGQPSDASIARAIGVAPQTLSSWRKRGVRHPPSVGTLRALARLIGQPYERTVLRAALLDAGWIDDTDPTNDHPPRRAVSE